MADLKVTEVIWNSEVLFNNSVPKGETVALTAKQLKTFEGLYLAKPEEKESPKVGRPSKADK